MGTWAERSFHGEYLKVHTCGVVPNNQPTKQSTNQSPNQSTNQSTNQPINRLTNLSTNHPTNNLATNLPTNQQKHTYRKARRIHLLPLTVPRPRPCAKGIWEHGAPVGPFTSREHGSGAQFVKVKIGYVTRRAEPLKQTWNWRGPREWAAFDPGT